MRYIDPPEGWRYGFPKEIPDNVDTIKWLVENGYPKEEIDKLGDYFICRYWNEDKKQTDDSSGP
jgi:hypothetical protein